METKTNDSIDCNTKKDLALEERHPHIDPNLFGALEMAAALALAPFSRR